MRPKAAKILEEDEEELDGKKGVSHRMWYTNSQRSESATDRKNSGGTKNVGDESDSSCDFAEERVFYAKKLKQKVMPIMAGMKFNKALRISSKSRSPHPLEALPNLQRLNNSVGGTPVGHEAAVKLGRSIDVSQLGPSLQGVLKSQGRKGLSTIRNSSRIERYEEERDSYVQDMISLPSGELRMFGSAMVKKSAKSPSPKPIPKNLMPLQQMNDKKLFQR